MAHDVFISYAEEDKTAAQLSAIHWNQQTLSVGFHPVTLALGRK
jgi:hypothetical protein